MKDLTVPVFEQWIQYFREEPYVVDQVNTIKKLHEDVFKRQQVNHIDYSKDLPEQFTKEMYIQTFRKIWATIRHDIYLDIKKKKKEIRSESLTDEQFKEIYDEVHSRFEQIRTDIYCMMMDVSLNADIDAREIMQKAYVTYATVTHIKGEDG